MDRLNLVDLGYELVAMTLHCGDGAQDRATLRATGVAGSPDRRAF